MDSEIIKVENNDIICVFDLDNKQYCAIDEEDSVSFGMVTELDNDNKIITSVLDTEIDKVIAEYEKIIEFFESEDESDIEEGE